MKRSHRLWLNFLAFQGGWTACVVGAGSTWVGLGTAIAVAMIALHLALSRAPRTEALLCVVIMAIGACWDSLLAWQSLLVYPAGQVIRGAAPYWIVVMWGLFATTLNVSLQWLKQRPWLSVLLGAVGGPLAYLSGQRLGAVTLPHLAHGVIAEGLGWAVLTPLMLRLADRLNGAMALPATQVAHV